MTPTTDLPADLAPLAPLAAADRALIRSRRLYSTHTLAEIVAHYVAGRRALPFLPTDRQAEQRELLETWGNLLIERLDRIAGVSR